MTKINLLRPKLVLGTITRIVMDMIEERKQIDKVVVEMNRIHGIMMKNMEKNK